MSPRKSLDRTSPLLTYEQVQHAIAIDNLFRVLVTSPQTPIPEYASVGLLPCSLFFEHYIEPIMQLKRRYGNQETCHGAMVKAGELYLRMSGCSCKQCKQCSGKSTRASRTAAGVPSAYLEEMSKAWYRRAGGGSWSKVIWTLTDTGPVSSVISQYQYIQGADDAPIQGLDWIVASVNEDAYTKSRKVKDMEDILIRTGEGEGYKLVLGPGQLMRRACGICRYGYAKDKKSLLFVTPTYTCCEISQGEEIFTLGGQDLSGDACPHPKHHTFVKHGWEPVDYNDDYLVPLALPPDKASSVTTSKPSSTPSIHLGLGSSVTPRGSPTSSVILTPFTPSSSGSPPLPLSRNNHHTPTGTSPSPITHSSSLLPQASGLDLSDGDDSSDTSEDQALIDLAGQHTPVPSDVGIFAAVGSSSFTTATNKATTCPSIPKANSFTQLHTPTSPTHLTCLPPSTSQPGSDGPSAECGLNERPSKRRAISSQRISGLSPLAVAIQSRRSLGPGERQEAQTKKRLMKCQQRMREDQAEVQRLKALLEGETVMRLGVDEAGKRETERRIRAERLFSERNQTEQALRREKAGLEGQLELAGRALAERQQAEELAKQEMASLRTRLADAERLSEQRRREAENAKAETKDMRGKLREAEKVSKKQEMEGSVIKREKDGLEKKLTDCERLLGEGKRAEETTSRQNEDLVNRLKNAEADKQTMRNTIHETDKEIRHLRGSLASSTDVIHRPRQEVQVARPMSLDRVVSSVSSVPSNRFMMTSQGVPTCSPDRADESKMVRELKRKIVSLEVDLVGKDAIITELYTRLG